MSLTPDCVCFIDNPPSEGDYGDCCCLLAILKVIYATLRHVHNSIVRIMIPIVTMNVQMVTLDAASGLYPHCSLLLTTATIHHLLGSDSSESLFEVILATLFLPRDLTVVVVVVVSPRLGWGREAAQIYSYPIDAMSAAWHSLHSLSLLEGHVRNKRIGQLPTGGRKRARSLVGQELNNWKKSMWLNSLMMVTWAYADNDPGERVHGTYGQGSRKVCLISHSLGTGGQEPSVKFKGLSLGRAARRSVGPLQERPGRTGYWSEGGKMQGARCKMHDRRY